MLTQWGYEILEELPPLIDYDTFNVISGGSLSATRETIEAKLEGVSSAIRDFCGWHVSPIVECKFTGEGEGRLLVIPCMGVTDLTLEIDGTETACQYRSSGLVRLSNGRFPHSWGSVVCTYKAGFTSATLGEVVTQIVSNALVAAPGITEEHAGNVGATYNKTGDGITGGVSLLARDMELLAPYKIEKGV